MKTYSNSQIEYNNQNEFAQYGKEIPNATDSYWTIYVLGAYETGLDHDHHSGMPTLPCPNFANGMNQGNAYVFCETIRDLTNTHQNCPQATGTVANYNTFFPRVVAHEILHSFLGSHGNAENPSSPYISDQTIMNYEYIYAGWDCSLNVNQIKQIQSIDKPKPGSQI